MALYKIEMTMYIKYKMVWKGSYLKLIKKLNYSTNNNMACRNYRHKTKMIKGR